MPARQVLIMWKLNADQILFRHRPKTYRSRLLRTHYGERMLHGLHPRRKGRGEEEDRTTRMDGRAGAGGSCVFAERRPLTVGSRDDGGPKAGMLVK